MKSVKNDSPVWGYDYGVPITNENSLKFLKNLTDASPLVEILQKLFPNKIDLQLDSATLLGIRNREEQNIVCAGHTDDSDITLNICIGARNLKGSEVVFRNEEKEFFPYFHRVGRCVVHSGVVHHHVDPIVEGERVTLLIWLKEAAKIKIK